MAADIDGIFPTITPQLLDELAGHASAPETRSEPVATAMWAEVVSHPIRLGIMQFHTFGRLTNSQQDSPAV